MNKENQRKYQLAWYHKNKERLLAQRRVKRNTPEARVKAQEYYVKNKASFNKNSAATQRKYRELNPERVKDSLARSRKNNPERNLFNKARSRAKKCGFDFNLELIDIKIPEYCPLLSIKLDSWGHRDVCPSLDRIDNTKGYIKDNIWIISFKANRMKNTATAQELYTFAQNILKQDVIKFN